MFTLTSSAFANDAADDPGAPAPPIGRHRYTHTLYALDTALQDLGHPTRAQLLKSMQGHVLAEAQLVGTHQSGQ